ncbi:MAG: hypothetical protein KBS89_06500 [Bacteroidales bacterium]|nr:hypothetical protein [Candidatus Egerieousia equi]
MKKGLIFFLGIITGCLLTFGGLFVIASVQNSSEETNITYAEHPSAFNEATKFEVFQVLGDGALANCEKHERGISFFSGPIVYLVSDGQTQYYDDQIISVPQGKRAMQTGTYRYQSQTGVRTVPVIKIQ